MPRRVKEQSAKDAAPTCAVVIPVYKATMTEMEALSMRQCMAVLGSRSIYLATHAQVDLSLYRHYADERGVELQEKHFDSPYFDGVEGYNRLMLSAEFYEAFSDYDYILIYQLDAYVFADELDYWCSQGYDYVGAPWFERFGSSADGELMAVGNGGFSLRRVRYFTELLRHPRRRMFGIRHLPVKGLINKFKYQLGGYNTVGSEIQRTPLNEDHFYCLTLSQSLHAPQLPDVLTAASFAFEQSPSYLYNKIGRLPMGCHAFEKYEFATFWQRHIKSIR